jgi:ABC-2 type transport system ATP-binding protein
MSAAEAKEPTPSRRGAPSAGPASTESVVRCQGLRRTFGSKVAVENLTLKIARGDVFGLIGPNGAGKTTTFSMLAGYLRPSSGSVEVLGYDPQNVDGLRGRIGVLPQDAILPPTDTVGDFLVHLARLQAMPHDRAVEESKRALAEVEGADWWKTKCGALSHGMAKRVGIAQAFLGTPEIVLLDEPTAGLDPKIAYEVRQIIKARKGRCTLVISSHNMHELEEMCDAAAILDHGRLVSHGTMQELTASSEEIRIVLATGPVPIEQVRAVPVVKRAEFDDETRELVVTFERGAVDAETVIAHVLWVLLNEKARISEVTKGRGLEQRVMELTG